MTTAKIPTSYDEVYRDYYDLIKWHCVRAKISEDAIEDYAMTLMEKLIKHGILEQYNPEIANFRTFLSGFVVSYLRHFKAQDRKRKERYALSIDYVVSPAEFDTGSATLLDFAEHSVEGDFDVAEVNFALARIRERIEASEDEKFLTFFDKVIEQVEEYGRMHVPELAEFFGVTSASIYNWRKRLHRYFVEAM